MWNDCFNHLSVLLVRGEIHHNVSSRKHFLVGADGETIFGCVEVGLSLFLNRSGAEGIRYIEAGVAHVETLVEPLGATAYNHDF